MSRRKEVRADDDLLPHPPRAKDANTVTGGRARAPFPLARVVLYALIGGAIALLLGLLAVAVAPDNGFADLAFASLTKIFFVPLGLVIGGVIGWRTAGGSPDRRRDSSPKGRNGGSGSRSRP